MREVGIGILGFGTVGAGAVDVLRRNAGLIAARAGVRPVLRGVADLDLERDRGVRIDRALLTRDAEALIDDPAVEIVIELIGGLTAAKTLIERALKLGKPVVTANKALLAEHGHDLFALARAHGTDLAFEASVGGGIPIIRALREGLIADRIESIYGILNGTCNYILTRMEREKLPFEAVLKEAQAAGYAEADPTLDVDGLDTAHKAVILATLAYGRTVPMSALEIEGIRQIDPVDLVHAAELGCRIKLLAVIHQDQERIEVGVRPTLVPAVHPLGAVDGVFNAVLVRGDTVGETLYYGRGAGRYPTASAVVADVVDQARRLAGGRTPLASGFNGERDDLKLRRHGDMVARHYIRLHLVDQPDVMARVTHALGEHGISIASILQKESEAGAIVPVTIMTHEAKVRSVKDALKAIGGLDCVGAPPVSFRVENFGRRG